MDLFKISVEWDKSESFPSTCGSHTSKETNDGINCGYEHITTTPLTAKTSFEQGVRSSRNKRLKTRLRRNCRLQKLDPPCRDRRVGIVEDRRIAEC